MRYGGIVLYLVLVLTATAQPGDPDKPPFQLPTPLKVAYSFSAATNYVPFLGYTNIEGAFCTANLVQASDGRLYGVAPSGGNFGGGTVFSIQPDGSDLKVLHTFSALSWRALASNEDGSRPAGLVLGLDGRLYGTASQGGTNGVGAIFSLEPNGSGFSNLYNFSTNTGANPQGALVQGPDGTLYGTAQNGGANDSGTVFSLRPEGLEFTVLYEFTALINGTNADGTQPCAGLILSGDGTLYGTARYGGPSGSIRPIGESPIGSGTVFSLKTNGANFTVLHAFDRFSGDFINQSNLDGASPDAALLLGQDGNLYGTAPEAGRGYSGTIFRLRTDGSDFTVLHTFNFRPPNYPHDIGYGLYPYGGLVQGNDGFLYGACYGGGLVPLQGGYLAGTLYRIDTDGSDLALLHSFAGLERFSETNSEGAKPWSTLLQANDRRMYGLTSGGGPNGSGTLFSFAPPVVLQVAAVTDPASVVITWPASATNFVLETSAWISPGAQWTAVTNPITTVNNKLTVTVPANRGAAFFRLHQF